MELENIIKKGNILYNEPMSRHTTFRTGGPVSVFVEPFGEEELISLLKECNKHNIKFYIIGNGSNILVPDEGIDGMIIKINKGFDEIRVKDNIVKAQAGALLSKIAAYALNEALTGFEFAAGIPGSLGGAITMNAGAYGGEMKNVVKSVRIMDYNGNIYNKSTEEMDFSYRHSIISNNDYIVLEADFLLEKGNKDQIRETMNDLAYKRRTKQPLEYPSAGSTFKRPEGYFAGKLIMDAGFSGYCVGDAQVSQKHCGFIINKGKATTTDILRLIEEVKKGVYDKFGVMLEPEVMLLK